MVYYHTFYLHLSLTFVPSQYKIDNEHYLCKMVVILLWNFFLKHKFYFQSNNWIQKVFHYYVKEHCHCSNLLPTGHMIGSQYLMTMPMITLKNYPYFYQNCKHNSKIIFQFSKKNMVIVWKIDKISIFPFSLMS